MVIPFSYFCDLRVKDHSFGGGSVAGSEKPSHRSRYTRSDKDQTTESETIVLYKNFFDVLNIKMVCFDFDHGVFIEFD